MSKSNDLISASISEEDLAAAIRAITEAWEKFPFLLTFTDAERKRLVYPGDDALPAMAQLAEVAKRHAEALAPDCLRRANEVEGDLALAGQLGRVTNLVDGLTLALRDTFAAARADAYRNSLRNLRSLREAAPDIPGLAAEIEPLEELLSERAKGRPAKPPAESAGQGTQSLAG